MKATLCALVGMLLTLSPTLAQTRAAGALKPIKVILRVEAQGPQGQWSQIGEDLSPTQLNDLRTQIRNELAALPNHRLVSPDDKDDCIGVVVVAEKLDTGRESVILLSSVITLATADQKDLFITHDVIAEPSVGRAAHAVVGQLAGAEIRALTALR